MADKKVYKVAHKFDLDQGETSISTSIQVMVASENGDHAKEVAMQHMKKLAAFAVHGSHSITDDFEAEPVEGKDSDSDSDVSEEENEQSVARDYWAGQTSEAKDDANKLVAESKVMLEAKLHLKEQVAKRSAKDEKAITKIAQELRYKYPSLSSSYREEITQQVIDEIV